MTGDWLDRAALAAEKPLSRRAALEVAGGTVLALGPLGALLRASAAHGATNRATDACLDCSLRWNERGAAERAECAKVLVGGLVSPLAVVAAIGCLGATFVPPPEGQCSSECRKEPHPADPTGNGAIPPWTFPARTKATPPRSKKSRKARKGKSAKSSSSRLPCGGTCMAYCLACPTVDGGDLCCSQPAKPDDPNPCCPKH